MNGTKPEVLSLPIGLPSLKIAWLRVPYPMTVAEYETLAAAVAMFRDALIAGPKEQPSTDSEEREP